MTMTDKVQRDVWQWIDDVIIGLNLCPFAKKPRQKNQIALYISTATNDKDRLQEFETQLNLLANSDPEQTDTGLVIYPNSLNNFDQYLDFLYLANMTIDQLTLTGEFQLASFHPNYQFDGTDPSDLENLTNTSPYPVIHIIREATVEKVLKRYPNPEQIPDNNITTVHNLSELEIAKLFPFVKQ